MKKKITPASSIISICVALLAITHTAHAQHDPIVPFKGKIAQTLDGTIQWRPKRLKAAPGSPNVIWILLDDAGFGASSAFGGLIETPTFEALANDGLRYTNFHTTGICSPTRAALLTGRNAHSVGMGHHAEIGIGTPGYSGDIPLEAGTVAEIFKENGYNTFALGKWHGNRPIDLTAAGPFNRYPTGRGFEHFFGFLGGATDQWHPDLVEENSPINIEPNKKHLNELLADKAIQYIANQKSANPEKPFFLYFAPGATHAPHQVAKTWSDRYKGKFDGGWDQYRETVFKRQQARGLVPAGTQLPPRQTGIKAWNSLSADEKKIYARFFEVYAGFLSYTDHEIGRVVDYLKEIEQYENTLIFVIIGDNGGSKEGTYTGTTGAAKDSKGHDITFLLDKYDQIGTELTSPNYPLGWSQAANTPFRYWKGDANSEGATHNPLIVHYPKLIKKSGIRWQYGHVTDLLPTVIELLHLHAPDTINGYPQRPFHGISLAYSIADSTAPSRHTQQYYEIHGGRAIYQSGWKAAVYHPRGFFNDHETDINFKSPPFEKDKWELYHIDKDWNEIHDVAAQYPEKLAALKHLFDEEAQKYQVYPLHNYKTGQEPWQVLPKAIIYRGATVKTKVAVGQGPIHIQAHVDGNNALPASGVIVSAGGFNSGGFSLYAQQDQLHLVLHDGNQERIISAAAHIGAGSHTIDLTFHTDQLIIQLDGKEIAKQALAGANRYARAIASDGVSLGTDLTIPVSTSYTAPYPFNGTVKRIDIIQPTP